MASLGAWSWVAADFAGLMLTGQLTTTTTAVAAEAGVDRSTCGSAKGSATSLATMNTLAEAKPSAKPDATDSSLPIERAGRPIGRGYRDQRA